MSLVSCAEGTATIREEIFENRFTHKKDLMKMGANIETCGKNAIIKGVGSLRGCPVQALDLRGGAALVLAGLMAEGTSLIRGIEHIERGYEDFAGGIRRLGGNIEKKNTETKKKNESADETADSDSGNRSVCSLSGIAPV
jgi:UDP-N-acetylglucosamine 1-carboxyvinyltransferase